MFITCPCHGWTYDLDGTLKRTPGSENLPGFDCQAIRLSEVRLETICGFVFVNPDPDALPTSSWYPGVEEELRAFVPDIDDLKPAEDVAVEEACNWKVSVENYSECHHCKLRHPTFSTGVIDPESVPIRLSPTPTICMVWRQVAREADEAGMDVLQRQDLSFGAYILSLTGRVAGCRGPRLSCNAVAEAWFFRSWAVVLRSYRLTRARDCRSTRSTPSGPCSELLAMSPLPLTPSFTRAIGSTLNVVVVGDNRIGMPESYDISPQGHRLRHTTRAAVIGRMTYAIDGSDTTASPYSSWYLWPSVSFQVYPGRVLNTYHWRARDRRRVTVRRGWYSRAKSAPRRSRGLSGRITRPPWRRTSASWNRCSAVSKAVPANRVRSSSIPGAAFHGWVRKSLGETA